MHRATSSIAAVILLFVTAMPAATACCVGHPAAEIASLHAAMPCCGEQCSMSTLKISRDHDVMLTTAPEPPAATAVTIAAMPTTPVTTPIPAVDHVTDSSSAPPPFLINSQFRI